MLLAPLAALLAIAGPPAPSSPPVAEPAAETAPLRPADRLLLRREDQLDQLLDRLVELLGVSITFDRIEPSYLAARNCGLLADREVPLDQAPAVIEGLLALHGFGLTEVQTPGEGPAVLLLGSVQNEQPDLITISNAAGHGQHPARRVRIRRALETRSASQLRATLRPMLGIQLPVIESDRSGEQLDGGIVVDGLGMQVADLLEVIDFFDSPEPPSVFGEPIASLLPTPVDALELPERASLLQLAEAYAARLDVAIAADPEARFALGEVQLESVPRRVAPEDAHAFFSRLLDEHGFGTSLQGPPEARVIGLHTLGQCRGARRLPVAASGPDALRDVPSLQVLVALRVEAVDVRQIPVQLRPTLQQERDAFLIAAGPDRLLIGGSAGAVARLWELVLGMEQEARAAADDPTGR